MVLSLWFSWLLEEASWEDRDEDLSLAEQGGQRVCVCPPVGGFVAVDGHGKAKLIRVAHCAQPCGEKGDLVAIHGSGAARVLGKAADEVESPRV